MTCCFSQYFFSFLVLLCQNFYREGIVLEHGHNYCQCNFHIMRECPFFKIGHHAKNKTAAILCFLPFLRLHKNLQFKFHQNLTDCVKSLKNLGPIIKSLSVLTFDLFSRSFMLQILGSKFQMVIFSKIMGSRPHFNRWYILPSSFHTKWSMMTLT